MVNTVNHICGSKERKSTETMCRVATKLFANFDFNLRGKFMCEQSHKTFKDSHRPIAVVVDGDDGGLVVQHCKICSKTMCRKTIS